MRVRDEIFVNLNHANKRSAKEFDAEDESVVSTLAVAAGVAIDNARLLAEGQRGKRGRGRGRLPGQPVGIDQIQHGLFVPRLVRPHRQLRHRTGTRARPARSSSRRSSGRASLDT